MVNIVLFGSPGAGKGTQAERLVQRYNLTHISTGDVFRYNIKNGTPLGVLAKSYIDKGQLVPDEVTINMLHSEVEKFPEAQGFIFDGFPRTTAQAKDLDQLLAGKDTQVDAMIYLRVATEISVARLVERGKTSGRKDDADEAIIRNRIDVYHEQTEVVKSYYQEIDKFYEVDGVGSIDEITERIQGILDDLICV